MIQHNNEGIPSVEEVLSRYADMVYRLAYTRTMNNYDAEDITQDVFLKYMKHQHEFCEEEHRKAWLIRVTINESKTFLNSAWNRKRSALDCSKELPEDKDYFAEVEDYGIMKEVARLPEKYRIIVHLFYFEEMSVPEMAALLNMKESTLKSLLFRARKMLRNRLNREDYDV